MILLLAGELSETAIDKSRTKMMKKIPKSFGGSQINRILEVKFLLSRNGKKGGLDREFLDGGESSYVTND